MDPEDQMEHAKYKTQGGKCVDLRACPGQRMRDVVIH